MCYKESMETKKTKDTPKKEREFGVILESIESDVKNVLEGNEANAKRLDRIEESTERVEAKLGKIDDRLSSVETILESVNLPALKQKVMTLEKRLDQLEARAK